MTEFRIATDHTLLDVAKTLVALMNLRPEKAEQFTRDWLSGWEDTGESPSRTVEQVGPAMLWDRMGLYMSRYVRYLTTEQQAQFVINNLPSLAALDNFQRCLSALVENCSDEGVAGMLREAGEAAEVLTGWELHAVLGELAGPLANSWDE